MKQPPKKWTFEQPKLKVWIESWCRGKVLNLFAGKTRLNVDEYRVDASDEFNPDYLGDAFDFVNNTTLKFDTIILDPPYSLRKGMEKYNGNYSSKFKRIKDVLPEILNANGIIITLGYHSISMGKSRGFKQVVILLIGHGGAHHDTILVIEKNSDFQ